MVHDGHADPEPARGSALAAVLPADRAVGQLLVLPQLHHRPVRQQGAHADPPSLALPARADARSPTHARRTPPPSTSSSTSSRAACSGARRACATGTASSSSSCPKRRCVRPLLAPPSAGRDPPAPGPSRSSSRTSSSRSRSGCCTTRSTSAPRSATTSSTARAPSARTTARSCQPRCFPFNGSPRTRRQPG